MNCLTSDKEKSEERGVAFSAENQDKEEGSGDCTDSLNKWLCGGGSSPPPPSLLAISILRVACTISSSPPAIRNSWTFFCARSFVQRCAHSDPRRPMASDSRAIYIQRERHRPLLQSSFICAGTAPVPASAPRTLAPRLLVALIIGDLAAVAYTRHAVK